MTKVYHGAGSGSTESAAEKDLFARFEALPDDWTMIHSAKWHGHPSSRKSEGEADFVIAHPDHGVLVLEVKGGEISVEENQWYTRSRHGKVSELKQDPLDQADRSRWALLDWLQNDDRTRRYQFAIFSAVAFPDSTVRGTLRPDCPEVLVIDYRRVSQLEKALLDIFAYWKQRHPGLRMSGRAAVDALVDLLVPTRQLRTPVAEIFERERQKIEELTEEQFYILSVLEYQKRATIVGGAGTGKTMIAMEKARRLADAGFRVLYLCFNRNLMEWVGKAISSDEQIVAATFHSVVGYMRNHAGIRDNQQMGWEEFNARAPDILLDALSTIHAPSFDGDVELFDAVIVDEAQDFEETWWVPLPDLLKDPDEGILYVFFDDNQRIYTQLAEMPIDMAMFSLHRNCRNTQHIHQVMAPYAVASETQCIGPPGRPIDVIPTQSGKAAADALRRVLHAIVDQEGVDPKDIVILTPRSDRSSQWKQDTQLGKFALTWDMDLHGDLPNMIEVCSIYGFKGLERAVVILTELDQARDDIMHQLVYVGLSRARHHVVVLGDLPVANGEEASHG